MSNLIVIAICFIAGIFLVRLKFIPDNAYKLLNFIVVNICLPSLALLYIPKIKISAEVFYPVSVMWIVFISGVLFIIAVSKVFKFDRNTTGALIMTAGLCNSSFVGFPVLLALFGEEGLKVGVIIDQAGSFLVLSTLGIIFSSVYSRGHFRIKKLISDIIVYPPFMAFAVSLIMNILNIQAGELLDSVFERLGSTVVVLALISVGMQLKFDKLRDLYRELSAGLMFKLLIAPALVYFLFVILLNGKGINVQVSIIESAMPPMVMGSVMAVDHNLNPRLANLMVGIGIPLSALTLAFWYFIVS